jgi:predicted DCC family thiol-disulfide oxidoreductase YuxK
VTSDPVAHLYLRIQALADSPALLAAFVALGCSLSVLFAVGWFDRGAALTLLFLEVFRIGWRPPGDVRGVVLLAGILAAHIFVAPAPYGSWAARGRPDPGGAWRMPPWILHVGWVALALATAFGGVTKLLSMSWTDGTGLARAAGGTLPLPAPLLRWAAWGVLGFELAFAPLALVSRLRPGLWVLSLGLRLAPAALGDFAGASAGMVLLHGPAFDPAWVRPRRAAATEWVFYDGGCGLCHRVVRFVLAEDREGDAFRFSPLGSDTFRAAVPPAQRAGLPDSLVVGGADGALLTRSAAALHILRRLGGIWRVLAGLGSCVPGVVRDGAYDGIARVRYRLFRAPAQACPIVPAYLQARFDP